MAENDQEKTEYQSQKKLEESREKGELPRSQELGTFVMFVLVLVYFGMNRTSWLEGLGAIMTDFLRFDTHLKLNRESLGEFMFMPIVRTIGLVAPLFLLMLLISPLVSMAQTRFNFAKDKLSPDWSRLDPVKGLQRMFSVRQVLEGVKSSAKIGLFAWLAWTGIRSRLPQLQTVVTLDVRAQMQLIVDIALAIGTRVAIMMGTLALLDFGYQWWEFQKKLRLTHQELKDEMKDREGNPLVRQRQRSLRMQAARRRMMSEVAKASVVVTNPTHYAVALTYDKDKAAAPYVSAKGRDLMALHIRQLARRFNVPIIENKPLARGLYRQVKVGQVIPNQFYKAIAEMLAFVYWLKRRKHSTRRLMPSVGRLVAPDEPIGP